MRAPVAILAILLFANSARCADADRERLDEESLRSYMTGEYDLIGRKADSTATYSGHVTLRDENGVLQVTRTIEGKTDKSAARFGTVAGTDRIPVLKMHFRFDGKEYDATYRWQSDPDNYPRFTGYVYLTGTIAWTRSAFSNPPMTTIFSEREGGFRFSNCVFDVSRASL
jgi:hypothetical protein